MNREIVEKLLMHDKNIIVNGHESTGKTISVMFPLIDRMIESKENILVLDSKEEYISKYTPVLRRNDYNIVIMNFKDLERSYGWNPLEYPYNLFKSGNKDKALDLIDKLGRQVFNDESTDRFWSVASKDLFTGIVLGLFEDGSISEVNLNSVASMMMSANKSIGTSDYLKEYFELKDKNSLSYISAASIIAAPKETKAAIISLALQKIRMFVSFEMLSHLLNRTTFKMDGVLNKPTAIFVITKNERSILNNVASLFLEQILNVINSTNSLRYNVILDNLESLDNKYNFTDLVNLDIDEKLKFIVSIRSIEDYEKEKPNQIKEYTNVINVNEESIIVSINNNEFEYTYENEYKHVIFIKNDEDYPRLRIENINLFNLEGYVNSYKKASLEKKVNPTKKDYKPVDVDALLKVIDEKIEKLENSNKPKYKSVLEKFKI